MDVEDEQSLEERLRTQNQSLTTRVTAKSNRYVLKDEKIQSYIDKSGNSYQIGDHIYLSTNKSHEPYSIACILDFRLSRKGPVLLEVCWYYRPSEIPVNLYHILIEDRSHETQNNNNPTSSIKDPQIISRELFSSEIKDFYPAIHIKGRCCVLHYQELDELRAFQPQPDTFFSILTYNPEARRLANTQGEIRVGPSHQAKLPLLHPSPSPTDEPCSPRELLLWKNQTTDLDLSMYLQAARSIAAFAGMCDRGLADDMYEVAQRDDTTINALTVLHDHHYDCTNAIQALVKCPMPKSVDRKWPEDEQKKFLKGIRQYGKNFFRIRRELLAHKQTSDLVEYYYLWKKTPQAQSVRPRRRQRPCSTSVNLSTTPTPAKQRNQKSSHSKDDSEQNSENELSTDLDEQLCQHCQNPSAKDLQFIGRESQLLCSDCRIHFKKYGDMPFMHHESSPYLFKPLSDSTSKRKRAKPPPSPDQNSALATRTKKKSRNNERLVTVKQEIDEEGIAMKKEIQFEEQENEKPSKVKTEDAILTPTPCKHDLHSPKLPLDHTKQSKANFLLSSPSSAFSRTEKKSLLPKNFDEHDSFKQESSFDEDGNLSDSSQDPVSADEGPAPLACDREFYNKSQGIILLRVSDRSFSQNSCARTDIILKRGSRSRRRPTDVSHPVKHEDKNSSKLPCSLDKMPPLFHSLPPFPHSDPLGINQANALFHPLPLHALANGPKPFAFSPYENPALRHLDPLSLRLINSAQVFANQSPYGRPPPPPGLDPATAALLLDPRYRSPFPSPASSPSSSINGTHNHAHIHSHSHTHLHLGGANDSPTAPPPLLPFANPLLHPSSMHHLARERELMSMMLANNNRFDPMAFALANSFQMPRQEDFSRRSIRDHNENELRRLSLDFERQQQFRFPFHHPPDELLRRY